MSRAVVLVLVGLTLVGACGDDHDGGSESAAGSEPVKIQTSMVVAATEGAEPTATGEVVEGSTLGGSPFCVGGSVVDSHGSPDPEVPLIERTITCPDGRLRMEITPEVGSTSRGMTQKGSGRIVGGNGAFSGMRGRGKTTTTYDPDPAEPASETSTGTVTR